MSFRIKILFSLVGSLLGFIGGYVLTNSYEFGLCLADTVTNTYDVSCINTSERIGDALFYGAGALSIVFFALLCFPQAFRAWKKFAIWFVPFSVFVFATYDGPSPGDFLSPHPEQLFQWFSGFYVIVSLVIIFLTTGKNK